MERATYCADGMSSCLLQSDWLPSSRDLEGEWIALQLYLIEHRTAAGSEHGCFRDGKPG